METHVVFLSTQRWTTTSDVFVLGACSDSSSSQQKHQWVMVSALFWYRPTFLRSLDRPVCHVPLGILGQPQEYSTACELSRFCRTDGSRARSRNLPKNTLLLPRFHVQFIACNALQLLAYAEHHRRVQTWRQRLRRRDVILAFVVLWISTLYWPVSEGGGLSAGVARTAESARCQVGILLQWHSARGAWSVAVASMICRQSTRSLKVFLEDDWILTMAGYTGCTNKKQSHRKMLYFSHDSTYLSQTFRLSMWVFTQHVLQICKNSVKTVNLVKKICYSN